MDRIILNDFNISSMYGFQREMTLFIREILSFSFFIIGVQIRFHTVRMVGASLLASRYIILYIYHKHNSIVKDH